MSNVHGATSPSVLPFAPREASRELWSQFHAYRRLRHNEQSPEEPISSDDVTEAHMKIDSKTWSNERFYMAADDRMVAFGHVSSSIPGTPEYPSNKHLIYSGLGVIGPYRRRGLGTALLQRGLEKMDSLGARIMTTWTCEPDGHAFAEHVGFSPTQVERMSRLDFNLVDWEQVERWIADVETRAPGAVLELYPDRLPEEFLEEYCPARTKLMNLMPWDDTDHGEIVVTPDDFRELAQRLDVSRTEHHTYIAREPDGTISGITDVAWSPEHPGEIEQWFTGVDPAYRGRGIGKALKAAMLRYCRNRYEGLEWVRTGNATTNDAMLAINNRLGFEEYRRYTTYQIGRDRLEAYLDGRS